MKVFKFFCYAINTLKATYEYELPNIESATLIAEALLAPEADTFFDKVRFFDYDPDILHTVVYRIERSVQPTENVML